MPSMWSTPCLFQSTPPRGRRRLPTATSKIVPTVDVSIHAPAREATLPSSNCA